MPPNGCSSEELSFPPLAHASHASLSSALDSPRLWNTLPDAPKPIKSDQRKSFSCPDVKEEKMDMLWEALNDELPRSRSLKMESDVVTTSNNKTSWLSDDTGVNVGCGMGRSLKVYKPEKKKPNIVVFIKVLKKLLLLRNSSHHRPSFKTHSR